MYTAQLISDAKNLELRRRLISVQFTEPYQEEVFNEETQLTELVDRERIRTQEFQFKIDETVEKMKRTVKQYLDELNFTTPAIVGDIDDVPAEVPPTPTQAELDKTAWDLDVAKLKKAQELLNCGVTFSAGQLTALATLRGKVATNFKSEYLG